MSSISEREADIISEFELFGEDWEARYEYLIDMGKDLPSIAPELKTEERIIQGCQSLVWLNSTYADSKMHFTADSDAIITKGMVALMIRVLTDQTPEEIVKAPLTFIDQIGLREHLSPNRANGLVSMITRMKTDSAAALIEHKN
jgi:cysteine desulfuration protein SufE